MTTTINVEWHYSMFSDVSHELRIIYESLADMQAAWIPHILQIPKNTFDVQQRGSTDYSEQHGGMVVKPIQVTTLTRAA
jgi:hypothetical protein